jgi:hypothetical protein
MFILVEWHNIQVTMLAPKHSCATLLKFHHADNSSEFTILFLVLSSADYYLFIGGLKQVVSNAGIAIIVALSVLVE